jgi:hypothetical protein
VGQYYDLVAGLPDAVLDAARPVPSTLEYLAELEERLDAHDLGLLEILRLAFDNRNLVTVLEDRKRPFDRRGNFDPETLDRVAKGTAEAPAYMEAFLQSRRENRTLFPGVSAEDSLSRLFYEETAVHPDVFVREWFAFDLDLRNVLAALNARASGIPLEQAVVGRDGAAEHILKSSAHDFSLGAVHPWVERLVAASSSGFLKRELEADRLRWDRLDELTFLSNFGAATALAFFLKLCIAERWKALDPEEGQKMLDRLAAGLVSGPENKPPES